jgi:hypothetical protein
MTGTCADHGATHLAAGKMIMMLLMLLLLLPIVEMTKNSAIAYRRVIKPANQVVKHL